MKFELGAYTVDISPLFVMLKSTDRTKINLVKGLLKLYFRGESVDGKEPPTFSVQIVSDNEIQLNGNTIEIVKALCVLEVVPESLKPTLFSGGSSTILPTVFSSFRP